MWCSAKNTRPNLTTLILLMSTNPEIAADVMSDPERAATAHPQYHLHLDPHDTDMLRMLRTSAGTVQEFIAQIATIVDGPVSASAT
jgi:hypothetical protein